MIFNKFHSVFTLVVLIVLTVGASSVKGENNQTALPAPDGLSSRLKLKQLISLAFKDNPRLKAAKKKWEEVIEKYPQVTAYEDPVFHYSRFIKSVETRVGPQEQKFSISQKIPFPGKLSLKGDIVTREAQIAKLEFEKQTRDLITELKNAYYELAYITKAIEITKQNKELAEHLAKISATDYSVDGTTLNDVFKAQSQLAQLSYDLILLTELKEVEITHINSILNRPPEDALGKPEEIPYIPFEHALDVLYQQAIAYQQELIISELEIEKNQKALNLSRMASLPNFNIGLSYIDVGEARMPQSDSGKNAYAINIGITIPLWVGKNRSQVNEAMRKYEGAVYRKKEQENKTFAAIKMAYFKLQNSERLILLYRDSLIPQAEQSMETAETWYKEKKGSFSGLLETQSVWLNFNLAIHRALADYYQRIAGLEKLVGVSLDGAVTRPQGAVDYKKGVK